MSPADRVPERGLFFSFEGVDGSGKSTQAELLVQALQAAGEAVVAVREPGGTALGERIRALLLDPGSDVVPRAELLLFAAARAQLVDAVIEPALAAGTHVVADRYLDSTTAYQGAGRGLASGGSLDGFNHLVTAGRIPDRTYLVLLPLDEAARRRRSRHADRMEESGDDFWERVSGAYERLARDEPDRILALDGLRAVLDLNRIVVDDARAIITART